MKKLLISLLIGSVLIGVGTGVLFIEFSEYSVQEYRSDLTGGSEHIYTEAYSECFDNLEDSKLEVYTHAGNYHERNGTTEVVMDKTVTRGIAVDIYYKGKKPNVSHYYERDYDRSRKVESLNIYASQYSAAPKDFFSAAAYIFKNKIFLEDASNFIVEKVVIRTAYPEKIELDY